MSPPCPKCGVAGAILCSDLNCPARIQDDYTESDLRFRTKALLRSGVRDPSMYIKARALKKLLDELDQLRAIRSRN